MNLRQVADLAVARLGLPIPTAKLSTIQAVARALNSDDTALAFTEALAYWVSTRDLESQCLEAICPLLVAPARPEATLLIRRAINRPSIASDALLSLATGSPILVASWTNCHSSPVRRFSMLNDEDAQLRSGTLVPPFFTHQLEDLQRRSGRPFMRQWAFEFRLLNDRYARNDDGYLDYFFNPDRQHVGQFVAHRSHLARSAFLRTLACAVQHWGMPAEIASNFSETAFPAEPIFLRLHPQRAPMWACTVQRRTASEAEDAPAFAKALIETIEAELNGRIMHCSLTVVDEPNRHVELEVFAIAGASDSLDANDALRFYEHMLGEIAPERDALSAFVSPDLGSDGREILGFMPLLLPLVGNWVGYLQSDIVGRVPYVPASFAGLPDLKLVPMPDRAMFRSGDRDVGSWSWWCWNWKPSHPRGQLTPTACCASLSNDAVKQLAKHLGGDVEQVWRISVWSRDSDYAEWTESQRSGRYKS